MVADAFGGTRAAARLVGVPTLLPAAAAEQHGAEGKPVAFSARHFHLALEPENARFATLQLRERLGIQADEAVAAFAALLVERRHAALGAAVQQVHPGQVEPQTRVVGIDGVRALVGLERVAEPALLVQHLAEVIERFGIDRLGLERAPELRLGRGKVAQLAIGDAEVVEVERVAAGATPYPPRGPRPQSRPTPAP